MCRHGSPAMPRPIMPAARMTGQIAGRRRLLHLALLLTALAWPAAADTLLLPAPALDRSGPVVVLWRSEHPAAGMLRLDWRDAAGRLVERHDITLAEALPELPITLDLRRARTLDNRLKARFQPAG